MEIDWLELPKDGAMYGCSITTFVPTEWNCPREATKALPLDDYNRLKETLPKNITLRGRAVCPLHQTMIERDFS